MSPATTKPPAGRALPQATPSAAKPQPTAPPRQTPESLSAARVQGVKAAKLPATLSPQLATLVSTAPPGDDWIYEVKFDGYRLLARIEGDDIRLYTRNGKDWTAKLARIAADLARLKLAPCWLDGEIVVLNERGVSDFGALQQAFDGGGDAIRYFIFDLPFCDGQDWRDAALQARRQRLAALLQDVEKNTATLRFSQAFPATAKDILRNACHRRLEGVIGKRLNSTYVSRRSPDWIKLKCTLRQEFVIGGYTEPQGSRTGIGALLLGIHDDAGQLRFAGSVGTGFDRPTLTALRRELTALKAASSPFFEPPRETKGHWVQPRLVAEVSFTEWTRDGKVRHAVFHGLRSDKPAQAIGREYAAPPPAEENPSAAPKSIGKKTPRRRTTSAKQTAPPAAETLAMPAQVHLTNPQRVIDPSTALTKRDLVDYYLHAAQRLLPHLAHRPLAFVRAPRGIAGQKFFQKHRGALAIEALDELPPEWDPGHPPLVEINSFVALIAAAQMNVVEFHTWNATSGSIEKPDRMVFDLDPGEGVPWSAMQSAADFTRQVLDELGLRSFLKTSGGKGLHVVVPLTPDEGWDTVKDFSHAVVEHLATEAPTPLASKSGAKNRLGKIYVDYLRNGRGATTAAAFSARARPGLGVSIPCHWDELSALTGGDQWTIVNAHERLESADDPWLGYPSVRQTLAAPRRALQRHLASRRGG